MPSTYSVHAERAVPERAFARRGDEAAHQQQLHGQQRGDAAGVQRLAPVQQQRDDREPAAAP